jgi:hypothetical protein
LHDSLITILAHNARCLKVLSIIINIPFILVA